MEIKKIFTELQQRQEEELAKAHEGILQNDEEKEAAGYARRSAFSEFEMWLDQSYTADPQLSSHSIKIEIERRIKEFEQEAQKFYSWNTPTTADEFRWQAEALHELLHLFSPVP